MKKLLVVLCLLLVIAMSACSSQANQADGNSSNASTTTITNTENTNNEIEYPLELFFTSGAGAWYSSITINEDGSFDGEHHDSEPALTGKDYPNGTVYDCKFEGKFCNITKINDYSYSLTLESVNTVPQEEQNYIRNGVLYKTSYPHGLMGKDESNAAQEFVLYTPLTPISELPESFLEWWPYYNGTKEYKTLSLYGLYNKEAEIGFFEMPTAE